MSKITNGKREAASDESTNTELLVGKGEGLAYGAALQYLTSMEASDHGETTVGDYNIAYVIEEAEGLYHMEDGKLQWHDPDNENCHIEVAVRNSADGRFLPGLTVWGIVAQSDGQPIGSYQLPFLWHPWIYHYGRNIKVPRDGKYILTVEIEPPEFPRHDRLNGKRFQDRITVNFNINIKTGRKISKAA